MERKWNVYLFKTDIRAFLINDFIFLIRILSTRIYTLYRDILFPHPFLLLDNPIYKQLPI